MDSMDKKTQQQASQHPRPCPVNLFIWLFIESFIININRK
jgi:hypothetical protein